MKDEGRVNVWKSPWSGQWRWICKANHCVTDYSGDNRGSGPIWELVVHQADAHARKCHHKPVSHDEDRTPPNGLHRVEFFTSAPEPWQNALEDHITWRNRVFGG